MVCCAYVLLLYEAMMISRDFLPMFDGVASETEPGVLLPRGRFSNLR